MSFWFYANENETCSYVRKQDKNTWRALENAVMNTGFHQLRGFVG